MKSTDFDIKTGCGWISLEEAGKRAPVACHGVYFFRLSENFGRLKGVSDILYIGKTENKKGLKRRFELYLKPGASQETNKRVNIFIRKYREKGMKGEIQVAWIKTGNFKAKEKENQLLDRYFQEHCELPPLNRNHRTPE